VREREGGLGFEGEGILLYRRPHRIWVVRSSDLRFTMTGVCWANVGCWATYLMTQDLCRAKKTMCDKENLCHAYERMHDKLFFYNFLKFIMIVNQI
jgi:hypothetical protein